MRQSGPAASRTANAISPAQAWQSVAPLPDSSRNTWLPSGPAALKPRTIRRQPDVIPFPFLAVAAQRPCRALIRSGALPSTPAARASPAASSRTGGPAGGMGGLADVSANTAFALGAGWAAGASAVPCQTVSAAPPRACPVSKTVRACGHPAARPEPNRATSKANSGLANTPASGSMARRSRCAVHRPARGYRTRVAGLAGAAPADAGLQLQCRRAVKSPSFPARGDASCWVNLAQTSLVPGVGSAASHAGRCRCRRPHAGAGYGPEHRQLRCRGRTETARPDGCPIAQDASVRANAPSKLPQVCAKAKNKQLWIAWHSGKPSP